MSEYKCHSCATLHDTDNMVCYCAVCYDKLKIRLAEAESGIDRIIRLSKRDAEINRSMG